MYVFPGYFCGIPFLGCIKLKKANNLFGRPPFPARVGWAIIFYAAFFYLNFPSLLSFYTNFRSLDLVLLYKYYHASIILLSMTLPTCFMIRSICNEMNV